MDDARARPRRDRAQRSLGEADTAVLAIDIGGTQCGAAIVDAEGAPRGIRRVATPHDVDADRLFAAVVTLAESVRGGEPVDAIGVGCGGPMRWPDGVVSPLHIPAWRAFPLRARLEQHFGRPCVVDNDAKAMALGEWWRGAGREAKALLGVIVSTGVGGGIVIDGRLLHGAHGNAGHIGHVIASPGGPRCECGTDGCVEAIASGHAIAARYGEAIDAASVAARARHGDDRARSLFDEAGRALARGIAAAAVLCDIDRVVIGGGVALGAWDLLWRALESELAGVSRIEFARRLPHAVRPASLGANAGLVGAAALVLRPQG
jgi:glucokinase